MNSVVQAMLEKGGGSQSALKEDSISGLEVVRERYSNLNNQIGNLSIKLGEVSSNIDNEFLSAYRVHMVEVQEDLKSLKQQVASAESALHDDSAVSTLEAEVNWFYDETTRLKVHAMSMRKDTHHIISRIDALNEQRRFLSDQLKHTLKRSKVLESEISYAGSMVKSSVDDMEGNYTRNSQYINDPGPGYPSTPGYPVTDYPNTPGTGNPHPAYPGMDYAGDDGRNSGFYKNPNKKILKKNFIPLDRTKSHAELKNEIRDILVKSKKSIQNRRRPSFESYSGHDTNGQLSHILQSRCPEELVLERELETVFKQILTRKKNEQERSVTSIRPARGDASTSVDDEAGTIQYHRRMGGVSGLGLELFSDGDRVRAVTLFLEDPTAFQKVVQVLAATLADTRPGTRDINRGPASPVLANTVMW
eukprot:CAMPEP_0119047390 /NCGR_PEP_ID=MMETSP1177-20130426/52898_1 /TAXON_ID=2985 /ORGANISM="Ochromonas sp, Strain CCMP1899" /LENGTH=418 /DNA_ID=CAMNT_0007021937 /DNA_START=161 /DNA_END=1414 /DNA_ORIENTATION=-